MDDDLKRISDRIRTWRDEAGLTLQQLGDRSGVAASTVHKIENYHTVPTIAVLLKLANGLNRRPSELLAEVDGADRVAVVRDKDRAELVIEGRVKLEHLAGTIPHNRLDVWRVQTQPGIDADSAGKAWQYQGEIVLLVEDGELEIEIADKFYRVVAGDSVHFDTSLSHRWHTSGSQPVTALILLLTPEGPQGDALSRIATAFGNRQTISAESVSD